VALAFHLAVYDPDVARRKGVPAEIEFSLHGCTADQARAALPFLRKFTERLEAHIEREDPMGFTKTGDGSSKDGTILPEPGDDRRQLHRRGPQGPGQGAV